MSRQLIIDFEAFCADRSELKLKSSLGLSFFPFTLISGGDSKSLGWDCNQAVTLTHDPPSSCLMHQDLLISPMLEHYITLSSSHIQLSD